MNCFSRLLFRIIPKIKEGYWMVWNRLLFILLGVKFGRNMRIVNKLYVGGRGSIRIGDNFTFTSGGNYNPICRNIRGSIYADMPEAKIEIGDGVGISSSCIWAWRKIQIGNNVNVGGDCIIIDTDAHPLDYRKRRYSYINQVGSESYYQEVKSLPVIIEDDVWIGARCQVLKGVHIGARSIIAAGSIVTKDIPEDVIAGGIPCRVIRSIKD